MTEIYKIKFNKYSNEQGVPCYMMYVLNSPGWVEGELLTPSLISIIKGKVIVGFTNGATHEFIYTPDVEIFRRDKNAKEVQTTDNEG